jgi:uncharacterized protein YndB with AHSA1/START domain
LRYETVYAPGRKARGNEIIQAIPEGDNKMKVEKSIRIEASSQEIWPFLVEPEKIMMWFDTFEKFECTRESHAGLGNTYYVEEKVPGPLRKINFLVVEWEENQKIVLKMTSGKNVNSYVIRFQLTDGPSGTYFNFFEEVGMPFGPVGKMFGWLGQNTADKMVENMLNKLKEISESKY